MDDDDKRGERNNNPCNLEDFNIPWLGLIGTDGPYCVFDTAEHGLRAGARDLHTKITLHGLNTIAKLVPVYAPKKENNVPAYISDLAQFTHRLPDDVIDADVPSELQALLRGVVHHECGRVNYSDDVVGQAVVDALMENAAKGHHQ